MKAESMYQAAGEAIHNFTSEENDALTRVGPGSLMGNLFRQYWIPVTCAAPSAKKRTKRRRIHYRSAISA